MTNTSTAVITRSSEIEPKMEHPVVFVNWPLSDDTLVSCDLLDGTDFSRCQLVFLDPLEFAMAHGLWNPDDDISEIAYFSFEERDFLAYLSAIRKAAETLRACLRNGGMLIIRANLPKSHIKVRKKSSTGTMKYTESLVSTFFWLEEMPSRGTPGKVVGKLDRQKRELGT